jgi:hypothetical protein
VAKAVAAVIIDEAGGLHPGIDDDRADEFKTPLLERFG